MLLYSSTTGDHGEGAVEISGDVALQTAHDVLLAQALGGPPGDVGTGRRVALHADEADGVQGGVGLSVAASVQPVAVDFAAGGWNRVYSAESGEGRFADETVGVASGGDHQGGGDVAADAELSTEARC